MTHPLRKDWRRLVSIYLGYQVIDYTDDKRLKLFNQAIKNIIAQERSKWKRKYL